MEDKEQFSQILDTDEKIIKTYRPLKSRAYFATILSILFITIIFAIWFVASYLDKSSGFAWVVPVIIDIVYIVVSIIMIELWCNKTIYAITNKRVLIRTGYIGVDYKSLNYDMLGAMTVNVNIVDKMSNRDTGTISFGSMSSPLTTQGVAKFMFQYIKAPYQVYREVKAVIDENKKN